MQFRKWKTNPAVVPSVNILNGLHLFVISSVWVSEICLRVFSPGELPKYKTLASKTMENRSWRNSRVLCGYFAGVHQGEVAHYWVYPYTPNLLHFFDWKRVQTRNDSTTSCLGTLSSVVTLAMTPAVVLTLPNVLTIMGAAQHLRAAIQCGNTGSK